MNAPINGRDADTDITVEFLEKLRPGGPWVLVAIVPDGATDTITAANADSVRTFVRANNGRRNLYYSVNPTRAPVTKKPKKADIARAEFVFADLDPEGGETSDAAKARYRAVIDAHDRAPTAVVDSGNGIQALYRLDGFVDLDGPDKVAEVEDRTRALTMALGGKPGTQNVDRILRLPGTTNLPNAKKVRDGRVACPTELISFNGAAHPLEAFPLGSSGSSNGSGHVNGSSGVNDQSNIDVDHLPVSERIKNLIRGIDDPDHPYDSRSERVFAALVAMAGASCTDETITAVMTDDGLPISAHVRDQNDPDAYLRKQIEKARQAAVDPHVAELNKCYALVLVGDKACILKTDGKSVTFLNISAFDEWHGNRFVEIEEDKKIALGKYWRKHAQRRQYEGVEFAPGGGRPGHFNLWRGFAVEPRPGDCSKFLAHLRDNVCTGNVALFNWVFGWFAQIAQRPDKKTGTSLVLRGPMGSGKTKVGEVFGSLFGEHYALVSDPRYVTGRFNAHMAQLLLLHADEAFWAGDRSAEGKLKDLVTGHDHFIEMKGKEAIRVRNHIRLFVTGNPDWLVPAGFEERRFAILDMGTDHVQDIPYFAAIDEEMNSGGREALLHELLNFDLGTVDLRTIPRTAALLEQQIATATPEQAWWLDTLYRGNFPNGPAEKNTCFKDDLFDDYIAHANKQGVRRRQIETTIGMALQKFVGPGLASDRESYPGYENNGRTVNAKRPRFYRFPPLKECRKRFAQMMRRDIPWEEPDGEWTQRGEPPM